MKYYNLFFAVCSVIALTGMSSPGNASEPSSYPTISNNVNSIELKPIISSESFQIAKSTFLPDAGDNLGWGDRDKINSGHNKGDNCAAYPLSSCPSKGHCIKCPFGKKYDLKSCETYYKIVGNSCQVADCRAYGSNVVSSIPANNICSIKTTSPLTCYQSCRSVSCSAYKVECSTASSMSNVVATEVCPDCQNTSVSNCTKRMCKITACGNNMKPNADGTACIQKDDTCPTNYFKSCDTGTQGDPKYTERGTACYQCKAASACDNSSVYRNQDGAYSVSSTQKAINLYGQYNTTTIPSGGVNVCWAGWTYPSGATINGGPLNVNGDMVIGIHGGRMATPVTFNVPVTVNGKIHYEPGSKFTFNKGISGSYQCYELYGSGSPVACPFSTKCDHESEYRNLNGSYSVSSSQNAINLYGQSNTTTIPSSGANVCWAGWTYPSGATINGGPLNVNGEMVIGIHGGKMATPVTFNVPVTVNGKIHYQPGSTFKFNKGITGNYSCYKLGDSNTTVLCPFSNCNFESEYRNMNGSYTVSSSQKAINLYGQSNTTTIPSSGVDVCWAGWTYPSGATINGGPLNVVGEMVIGIHGGKMATPVTFNVPVSVYGKIHYQPGSTFKFNKGITGNYSCFKLGDSNTAVSCPF